MKNSFFRSNVQLWAQKAQPLTRTNTSVLTVLTFVRTRKVTANTPEIPLVTNRAVRLRSNSGGRAECCALELPQHPAADSSVRAACARGCSFAGAPALMYLWAEWTRVLEKKMLHPYPQKTPSQIKNKETLGPKLGHNCTIADKTWVWKFSWLLLQKCCSPRQRQEVEGEDETSLDFYPSAHTLLEALDEFYCVVLKESHQTANLNKPLQCNFMLTWWQHTIGYEPLLYISGIQSVIWRHKCLSADMLSISHYFYANPTLS